MPYVRITRMRMDLARFNEAAEELQRLAAEVASATRQLPGCQSYIGGSDFARGRAVSISMFDTLEHAQVSREVLGAAITRLQELGLQLEDPEIYEVTG